jgi:hypothetical protein
MEDAISILGVLHSKKLNRNDNRFCGKRKKKLSIVILKSTKKLKIYQSQDQASDLKNIKNS